MKTDLIKQIRDDLRMTQVEFARHLGRGQATVSRWERDPSSVTLEDVAAIVRLMKDRGVRFPDRLLRETVS